MQYHEARLNKHEELLTYLGSQGQSLEDKVQQQQREIEELKQKIV